MVRGSVTIRYGIPFGGGGSGGGGGEWLMY